MAAGITLKKNYEFSRVYRRGKRYSAPSLTLHCFPRQSGAINRLGYAVSRTHRTAVRRNRLKRLLREAYRSVAPQCKGGFDLILTARAPEKLPTYDQVLRDLKRLLRQADLYEPPAAPPAAPRGEEAEDD